MKLKMIVAAIAMLAATNVLAECTVTYSVDVETADGQDVLSSRAVLNGLPMEDVEDNSKRGMRVIDLASKLQEKGGPYTVELGELRACDGKPATRYAPNSIEVRGVTLDGFNKLSRLSLKVAGEVTDRYEKRAAKGDKAGWDHKRAAKVKRDDRGRKQVKFD